MFSDLTAHNIIKELCILTHHCRHLWQQADCFHAVRRGGATATGEGCSSGSILLRRCEIEGGSSDPPTWPSPAAGDFGQQGEDRCPANLQEVVRPQIGLETSFTPTSTVRVHPSSAQLNSCGNDVAQLPTEASLPE